MTTGLVRCAEPGCEATVKDHAWGKIKADGWFFTKTGEAWCPDHNPEWVAEWRARQMRLAEQRKAKRS